MTTYQVTYIAVVEAENEDDALDEARQLVADPRFEATVTEIS